MKNAIRIIFLVLPLIVIPLLGSLVSNGKINFGGGEKDLWIVVILGLWTILFFFSGLFLWEKNKLFHIWFLKSIRNSILMFFLVFGVLISILLLVN
ncbi:MAG: hypothetical protein KAJ63_04470 [Methyloprofundus sp.]|nr:hypothetical protein [Methyloprofundus sp.]